jgi:hypothetical protein
MTAMIGTVMLVLGGVGVVAQAASYGSRLRRRR